MKSENVRKIWFIVTIVVAAGAVAVSGIVFHVPQFLWILVSFYGFLGFLASVIFKSYMNMNYKNRSVTKKVQTFYKYFNILGCIGFFLLMIYNFLTWMGFLSDF